MHVSSKPNFILLGLENIHNLTKMTKMNLRVDLRDGSEQVFARYSTFEVSNRNYKLSVGGYSGTAGDMEIQKLSWSYWLPKPD